MLSLGKTLMQISGFKKKPRYFQKHRRICKMQALKDFRYFPAVTLLTPESFKKIATKKFFISLTSESISGVPSITFPQRVSRVAIMI